MYAQFCVKQNTCNIPDFYLYWILTSFHSCWYCSNTSRLARSNRIKKRQFSRIVRPARHVNVSIHGCYFRGWDPFISLSQLLKYSTFAPVERVYCNHCKTCNYASNSIVISALCASQWRKSASRSEDSVSLLSYIMTTVLWLCWKS